MSENQTAEQIEQAAQTEFESGFKGTRDDAPAKEPEQKVEVKPEAQQSTTQEQETPQASSVVPGVSDDQLRELLAKAAQFDALKDDLAKTRDTLHGKIGELNRTMQEKLKATPQGAAVGKLGKDALKNVGELNAQLAEALGKDLGALQAPDVDLDEKLNPRLSELEQKLLMQIEQRALLRQHKDFYEQIKTPEFQIWSAQQSTEDQQEFNKSIDSDYLAGKMSAFKTWRASLDKKQEKQRRLEQAVKPTGTQVADGAVTDEQAFEQGFKGVRGLRT